MNKSLSIFVNKKPDVETPPIQSVEEPQTVTERIEEISKERAKQKDLIHEMVMDKLQSKKQMNAEKRLNRSRNRSSMFSPGAATPSPLSMSAKTSSPGPLYQGHTKPPSPGFSYGEKILYSPKPITPVKSLPRPASELYTNNELIASSTPHRLTKTQSFSTYQSGHDLPAKFIEHVNGFTTPVAPPRRNRQDDASLTQTEKMRQDARARARLKCSQDLGLSPDENLLLLRRRFHLDESATPNKAMPVPNNKSDDMKVRERKMMASKSVNDIASVVLTTSSKAAAETPRRPSKTSDHKSETNLTDNSSATTHVKRRQPHPSKDPERRKSIIQAVSDFFHKKKELSPTAGAAAVAPKDSNRVNDTSMFGRFRISPKTKSKVGI